MQKKRTAPDIQGKRVRPDRLIGVRLNPTDYRALAELLAREAASTTDYLRRLIRADHARHH